MLLAMPTPGQAVTLMGLGSYPQTDGACWMPPGSTSAPQGGWVKTNDPLALCTYQGPGGAIQSAKRAIPWWVVGLGALAAIGVGYKIVTRRK